MTNVILEAVRLKRKVFGHPQTTDIEGEDVTCWYRLFQVRTAVTGKARSPTVDSSVWRTVNDSEEAELKQLWALKSVMHWSSSAGYDGAVPSIHFYTDQRAWTGSALGLSATNTHTKPTNLGRWVQS